MSRSWMILAGFLAALPALCATGGCDKKSGDAAGTTASSSTSADGRSVQITVDGKGFAPSSVDVKKGEKMHLVFKRTTDDTCAKEVVFPDINLKKELPLNLPVTIDVPTDTARTLTFQCGMGMYKSKVVIN